MEEFETLPGEGGEALPVSDPDPEHDYYNSMVAAAIVAAFAILAFLVSILDVYNTNQHLIFVIFRLSYTSTCDVISHTRQQSQKIHQNSTQPMIIVGLR